MDLFNKKRKLKYDRVMSRIYNQSRSTPKPKSYVTRHEIPSSVSLGAKPSVSNVSSSVYSELPVVLNDYSPSPEASAKRTFVVKPRKTLKSMDPARSPHRTVYKAPDIPVLQKVCNVKAGGSTPVLNRRKAWSDAHLRECYSSRSHTRLKELKDEIKAYHETDKHMKLRSRLFQSCGVVLDDFGQLAADKAIQVHVPEIASAWAPASRKLGVQKLLSVVQRGFAQKLCKSYRTVSLHSALALAGILPLDLRIQQAAALYEARRASPPPALGDRETESMVGFAEAPHPAEHMDLEFINLVDQQLVDRHKVQAVRIFTDGSKIEGKVGAALSLWDNAAEIRNLKLSLSAYCTFYQAELLAIWKASGEILKRGEASYGVYSDSRAALETVVNHGSLHLLAVETRRNLRGALAQGKEFSLFWVRAHAGLPGNERADDLAKEAALKSKRKPDYDRCPMSYVKRMLRNDTLDTWNARYTQGDTASVTRVFLPDAIQAYRFVRKFTPCGKLTQVLTGHGGFCQYLHRFKCRKSPSCVCDPESEESILHLLTECPVYARERHDIENRLETEVKLENLLNLLVEKTSTELFIN